MDKNTFIKLFATALCLPLAFVSMIGCDDKNDEPTPSKQETSENDTPTNRTDNFQLTTLSAEQKSAICEATSEYSWNLLAEVAKVQENKNDNVFVSPLSLAIDLAMLQNGVNGATLTEIVDAMGLNGYSSADVNTFFSSVVNEMVKADENVTLNIANAVYYNTGEVSKLGKDFTGFLTEHYDALVKGGAFDDAMKNEINAWCNEQTKGTIPTIIDKFDDGAVIELLNAIYFKGFFTNALENSLFKASFTNANGDEVSQHAIHTERNMSYYEDADMQYAELPLGNGSFNVFFILPTEGNGLISTASTMATKWNSITSQLKENEVSFSVPRFKVEFNSKLNDVLRKMGANKMFGYDADLSGCFDKEDVSKVGHVSVSSVSQKSFFELTDKGVEASAVTVIAVSKNGVPSAEIKYMRINRPFIFGIREKSTGAILFNGICNDPTLLELDSKIEEFELKRP